LFVPSVNFHPSPIIVLTSINVGAVDVLAAAIALEICS
jgi:hypothetical protein